MADHRGVDWQDSFTLFRNGWLVSLEEERETARERGREREREIPFTRLKYNLLSRIPLRGKTLRSIYKKKPTVINKRLHASD